MKWLELSVRSPHEFVEPLSQIFYRYGQGGIAVEEDGGFNPDEGERPRPGLVTLKTYLPIDATTDERRAHIDLGVRLVAHLGEISPLHDRVLEEEEWRDGWKRHFRPLHIGRKLVISPTWRRYRPKPSDLVIRLDPGMAFGTGHHPTTRMCLELLEESVEPEMDVLDVGCGSGILSIAAARLGARRVLGLDVDPTAADVAVENVRRNRVAGRVRVEPGTLPHPDVTPAEFDLAVANISAKVVREMAADLVAAVRPGGRLIASGVLEESRSGVEQALTDAGGRVERAVSDGDWVTLAVAKE